MQPEPGKRFHAERQQRFANVKPWKLFAFEYNHTPPGAGEQRSSRASGRSAAYDGDIVNTAAHRLILANYPKLAVVKGRTATPYSTAVAGCLSFACRRSA